MAPARGRPRSRHQVAAVQRRHLEDRARGLAGPAWPQDPPAGPQLCEQPDRVDQRRGRSGGAGPLGRGDDLCRRGAARAAPVHRRAGARLRLPGVLVVQVLRSPPGSALGTPAAPRRAARLQGALRIRCVTREMGNRYSADRAARGAGRVCRLLRLAGWAGERPGARDAAA